MPSNVLVAQNGADSEAIGHFLSPECAIAKANGYLSKYVGVLFGAEEPIFFQMERPVWQLSVTFKMDTIGPFIVGLLDVDAYSGEVLALPSEQICMIHERTDAYLKHHTLSPEATG